MPTVNYILPTSLSADMMQQKGKRFVGKATEATKGSL